MLWKVHVCDPANERTHPHFRDEYADDRAHLAFFTEIIMRASLVYKGGSGHIDDEESYESNADDIVRYASSLSPV